MEEPPSRVPEVSSGPHLLLATVSADPEGISVLDAGVVDLSVPGPEGTPVRNLAPPEFFNEDVEPLAGDEVTWGRQTLIPGTDDESPRIDSE